MPAESKTITIVYQEAQGKPSIPVAGAWGGPSPDGTAVYAHLYTEYGTVPSAIKHPLKSGNKVDLTKEEKVLRSEVTREVLATLVLAPETAASIGQFLVEKAALAMKNRAKVTIERKTIIKRKNGEE